MGAPEDQMHDAAVTVLLSSEGRSLLAQAVLQAAGPAHLTAGLVHALGYRDLGDLHEQAFALRDALRAEQALTRKQWTQALLLTELMWVSDEVGAASDWDAVTDFTDEAALAALRSAQQTLSPIVDARLLD